MDCKLLRWAGLATCVGWIPFITGCAATGYRANIQAPYSYDRIMAIREAGERRDQVAVPLLVDRLEDEDAAVRFYAILALERITGDRLGYRYADSAPQRQESVTRWRKYAADRKLETAEADPPTTRPDS